jgi:PAS domain S-box-containing protein
MVRVAATNTGMTSLPALDLDRLRDFVASMADWTWEVDAAGRYTYCGPQVEKILGYRADELIGRSPFELMAPEEVERVGALFGEYAAAGRPIRDLENWNIARDGRRVCLRTNGRPHFADDGALLGYRGTDTDITDLKRIELENLTQLNLLRTLMDAIPNPIYYKDVDGVYLGCNASFAACLGLRPDAITGRSVRDLIPPSQADVHTAMDNAVLKDATPRTYGEAVAFADGSIRDIVFEKSVFPGPDGQIAGLVGVMNDVTRHKALQEQLTAALQAAERASEAKSAFLANMSHEIRTPFNAILGFTSLMLQDELPDGIREQLSIVHDSARQLLDLLNAILDFSRVEAGHVELRRQPVEIRGLLGGVADLFRAQAAGKGLEIRVDVAGDLPQSLLGDAMSLRQVLINLVGNALKFTEEGSVVLSAERACGTDGAPAIVLAVTDTGVGIDPDGIAGLFAAFVQGDVSDTRRHGGTGLGLSIARQLVEIMGGRITATSEPGRGSEFRCTLPLQAAAAAPAPAAPAREAATTGDLRGRRVLVAEDNPVNQRLISRLLERWGAEVHLVSSGLEAADAAVSEPFDIVLMDIQMPGMDGLAATRLIRQHPLGADLPILAVTASVTGPERERYESAGFDGVISKPVIAADLLQAIDDLCDRSPADLT